MASGDPGDGRCLHQGCDEGRRAPTPHDPQEQHQRAGSLTYVTAATISVVSNAAVAWLVLVVRVPAEPSRHRVAVWRELRKSGAVSLAQGAWAVPDVPGFAAGISRVGELATRGGGELVVLRASGRGERDAAWLESSFTELRQQEWAEFVADCGK